ncbi:hypothetical protein, partial [Streptomyces sp. NPDC041003]|uniref:hypothetical protein n=1 Tax=Streptomyces sp. NPDC041003 TaxID=3155730 RepID=UPI0033D270FE
DVPRRMRVRQGTDSSAGIWLRQASATTDSAFVGMGSGSDSLVGFYGNGGAGWGMVMDTVNGNVGIGTTSPKNGLLDVRVGQGRTAVATVGKLDVEGYQGYAAVDVRGQVKIAAKGGYDALTIEQSKAGFTAARIHGTLHIEGYAGYNAIYANGDVRVIGQVTGVAQRVLMDHPSDPVNKYLSHTTIQSPEMTTFYDGTVVTDEQGEATVELPGYFQALNGDPRDDGDFRYQLTPVGCMAVAVVVGEIQQNRFTIRTDKPRVKVSWQVTGTRRDAWAKANRMEAEVDKPESERVPCPSVGSDAPAKPGGDGLPQVVAMDSSSPRTGR